MDKSRRKILILTGNADFRHETGRRMYNPQKAHKLWTEIRIAENTQGEQQHSGYREEQQDTISEQNKNRNNWLFSFGGEATCSLPAVSERIAEVSFAKLSIVMGIYGRQNAIPIFYLCCLTI